MNNISIFCGAHEGKNPEYAKAAKLVAELIAKKGINVVFGGGNVGLMTVSYTHLTLPTIYSV